MTSTMSSPSPVFRSLNSTPGMKNNVSHNVRDRRKNTSPFVYTSPIPPNFRENVDGSESVIHRIDKATSASRLIRPISLAAIQKASGTIPFEPGDFNPNPGNLSKRNSLSARQWSTEHNPGIPENGRKDDIKIPNKFNEDIGIRSSQALIASARYVAPVVKDYSHHSGKTPTSCGDNPFAYSSGSRKFGLYRQGTAWDPKLDPCRKRTFGNDVSTHKGTITRNMGSHYLQQHLKLLSRPKLMANFDANFKGQTRSLSTLYERSGVNHETYLNLNARDVHLFDPLIIDFPKPKVTTHKSRESLKSQKSCPRKTTMKCESIVHFAGASQMNYGNESYCEKSEKSNNVADSVISTDLETLENVLYTSHPEHARAHRSLDNQISYAISVKNPTAKTVVLLRNQTSAYLRSALSSRFSNFEQPEENADPIAPSRLTVFTSFPSTDNSDRTFNIHAQSVGSITTVTVQNENQGPAENECFGSVLPKFNIIKPDAITTPQVYVCRSAKQVEMDSGNGTDEDDLLMRDTEDSAQIAAPFSPDENSGQYEDDVNELDGDDADGSDEASDSSGVIESDENPHGDEDPLPEEDPLSTNEETVTNVSSILTKNMATDLGDGQLDAYLNGSGTVHFNRKKLEILLQKQMTEEESAKRALPGIDTQTEIDNNHQRAQSYQTPSFANHAGRTSEFVNRNTSRTPLIPTLRSSRLEGTEINERFLQNSKECGHISSKSNPVIFASSNKSDMVTGSEGIPQITKLDKEPVVSLEFRSTQSRADGTLSQPDAQAAAGITSRQSPAATNTKDSVRRTTRKHIVPRHGGSGESTPHPALISSLFPNVPPVLRFVDEGYKLESLPWEFRRLLRWRASMLTPAVVRQALLRSGFRVSKLTSASEDLETIESPDWVFYFGKHMRPQVFRSIREYQKVNHLPCSFQLGRKDRLWKNLVHMQMRCGKDSFNYMPQTFCLPNDLEALKKVWDEEGAAQRWILKPPASARGIGVRLITKWAQVPKKRPAIVQRYLSRPFLINESKFDLRIYVYISSINPLRVYIHEDGLVRFASQKYTNSSRCLGNRFIHLTNYSINRLNAEYVSNTNDQAAKGHKWSLRALWAYLRSQGISPAPVWSSIKDVVVKTAISTEAAFNAAINAYCNHPCSVHEVFGFDILLDEDLQPWLLEVNVSPSMHSDSPLDVKIKGNMVRDMLNISGLHLPEPSDTNSHTVIPSCIVKSPAVRHQSSEQSGSALRNPSPSLQTDMHGFMVTPAAGSTDIDSSLGTVEQQRLKSAGDIESSPLLNSRQMKKIRTPSHEWVIDSRLNMTQLSKDEREKRRHYMQRALQYDFPKSSPCTVGNGSRGGSSVTPNSTSSSLVMGNNNYQYSSESDSSKASCIGSVGSTRIARSHTPATPVGTTINLATPTASGMNPICMFHSNLTTPTPKSDATHDDEEDDDDNVDVVVVDVNSDSDSNDDDHDNDDVSDTSDSNDDHNIGYEGADKKNMKYVGENLSDNTNNKSKKAARSMGIGPSSPDLKSHRAQNKEAPSKPPAAPLSLRAKVNPKQTVEARAASNTPRAHSTHRSGYHSGSESPSRSHALPRVRLASATANILECLTPSDVRILVGMVDELERAGGFECIFPPPSAGLAVRYLSYFEAPRYPNLLCIAYLQKYADNKETGIEMLRKHCANNVHLISGAQGDEVPRENQWHLYMKNKMAAEKQHSPAACTPPSGPRGKPSLGQIHQREQS